MDELTSSVWLEQETHNIKSRSHRSRVCCVLQSEEDLWSRSGDESQTRRRRHSLLRLCNTHDLLIKNVTEADLGLYYCALHEKNISKDKNGVIISRDVYHYGNRSTRLSLLEPCRSVCEPSVSEPSVSWKLVFSVCVVCVLLSSLLSSICVYCLCTNTTKAKAKADLAGSDKRTTRRCDEVGEDEVCYAALDIQNIEKKKTKRKKKRVQHSDFSTYSEVRTERTEGC
ncbi:uncharacterized protein LOC117596329 [Pangasianodon hypophthalmus]|uniref:uncharacterized protein LOC117596329 n=1 Tax=Pangasianodon hypophthalmus TaxID=310915 RepID=UPI0023072B79|nr:uncharacterized protein LOC117596329 [Pangasianodon hypophthalmus]